MKKKQKTHKKFLEENQKKKKYFSPTLDIILVGMECGIAANSAAVSPVTVAGSTDQVQTDWKGNDDTVVESPFF